jgi:hypothetical protein
MRHPYQPRPDVNKRHGAMIANTGDAYENIAPTCLQGRSAYTITPEDAYHDPVAVHASVYPS